MSKSKLHQTSISCNIINCERKAIAKNLCSLHYYQLKRYGYTPARTRKTPNKYFIDNDVCHVFLYDGNCKKIAEAFIDVKDVKKCYPHKWSLSKRGYPVSRIKQKLVCLHTFLTGWSRVDHIDRNPLNNSRYNLRKATQQQNVFNSRGSGKTSRFKGVWWEKRRSLWASQIKCGNKRHWVGYFTSEIDAAKAYDKKALELFGEFAYLNFKEI